MPGLHTFRSLYFQSVLLVDVRLPFAVSTRSFPLKSSALSITYFALTRSHLRKHSHAMHLRYASFALACVARFYTGTARNIHGNFDRLFNAEKGVSKADLPNMPMISAFL
jgi:hypothetical protein